MDSPKKKRARKITILATAGLLPLILCVIFTWVDARHSVQRQQEATADMLLAHAETISDQAWNMIDQLRRFSGKQCDDVNENLRQYAALYPYFRAVGVMQDGLVTCSSAFGSSHSDIKTMLLRPPPENRKAWWMLSVAGTRAVKDRPAVIFVRDTPSQFSTFALIDGQYLLDFMNAIDRNQDSSITLQFGGGAILYSDIKDGAVPAALVLNKTSSRYPVTVHVTSPASDVMRNWRHGLLTFVPVALILSLLLVAVINNWLERKLSIRDRLRRAIVRREFSVQYQPVYHIATGQASGVEALMRWHLPDGNQIRPDLFIAAAEAEGMIVPLTRHLMQLIAEEAKSWSVPPDFHLAINVAAEHVQHEDFVSDIRQFAAAMATHQSRITLELTERSLLSDGEDVVQKLQLLRSEGIRIAIDDFGTGHCSLSYLQTFPLDYLKIDRGFINAIESVEGETPVLDAIIMLSHKLKLKVVAEGIETPLQLQYVKDRGVVFIQGYLYARPMESSILMEWLQQQGQHPLG